MSDCSIHMIVFGSTCIVLKNITQVLVLPSVAFSRENELHKYMSFFKALIPILY